MNHIFTWIIFQTVFLHRGKSRAPEEGRNLAKGTETWARPGNSSLSRNPAPRWGMPDTCRMCLDLIEMLTPKQKAPVQLPGPAGAVPSGEDGTTFLPFSEFIFSPLSCSPSFFAIWLLFSKTKRALLDFLFIKWYKPFEVILKTSRKGERKK